MLNTAEVIDHLSPEQIQDLIEENHVLREEIRVSRESAEITANLVVKQFEETERILRRFQIANAQRKAVLDSAAQMAIIATNKDGLITVFNKGAENLLGYKGREIMERETPESFHVKTELAAKGRALGVKFGRTSRGMDILFRYAVQGRYDQEEWTYIKKDGTEFPVSMSINALHSPEGGLEGILCIASDITEKKESEKALKESETNYRLLIKNIPNIVYKWYPDGSIDFYDDKIEKLTGYSKETFTSREKLWTELIIEEDQAIFKERFVQALRTDGTYIRQYRIRKKNGDLAWIEAGSQIIYDEDGNIDFVTGAFLDITHRKKAEEALHESEEKYRSLFDSGPSPIFVLDMHTLKIIDANPTAEETYGYPKEELIGKRFPDLGEFEHRGKGLEWYASQDRPEECLVTQKARHKKKDGTTLYIRVHACPIKYQGRDAIILAATDITESMEKDAQLFQASKMTTLGEMSAGIAHELNQPLNAIKVGSEYLRFMTKEDMRIPEENLLKVATEISDQVDRATQIINSLREFGRRPDFQKERVSVNDSIGRIMGIIGQQFALQEIQIETDLEDSLPLIVANSNRLEQVFFNLLTNARDAIEQRLEKNIGSQKGLIRIHSYSEEERIVIAISDNGIGIPEEARQKVFEPFFTSKEVGKGMGLGLSIIYGIVQDYGGKIDFETELGRGTAFICTFPRAN